ncbi:hypothetical protein NicSoilB8_25500 [Arthrobacter sp. NicSoilB8]|nr:hypothetical protein NicSoilB8_25500 [Arthrobacter sp. NicSoilB8]
MADRYFPAADPKAPVGLIRTPYGRRSANILVSRLIAERGYQVLIQSLRGTGGSGGTFNGFAMNHDDGPATIKWMRGQDWFPGVFATWGASYLGYAQWDLASQSIPEWKVAIIDGRPSQEAWTVGETRVIPTRARPETRRESLFGLLAFSPALQGLTWGTVTRLVESDSTSGRHRPRCRSGSPTTIEWDRQPGHGWNL